MAARKVPMIIKPLLVKECMHGFENWIIALLENRWIYIWASSPLSAYLVLNLAEEHQYSGEKIAEWWSCSLQTSLFLAACSFSAH